MAGVAVIMLVAAIGGPQWLRAYAQGDGGCSASTRIPMPDALEQARTATLCLINRERAAHGLPALAVDARLTQAAQWHADDMGKRDFYDHRNPDGAVPSARVYAQGLPQQGTTVAENIHWATGWLGTPREIMRDWMNSPAIARTSCAPRSRTWAWGSASMHRGRDIAARRGSTRRTSSAATTQGCLVRTPADNSRPRRMPATRSRGGGDADRGS